jgi:hypothetical protein
MPSGMAASSSGQTFGLVARGALQDASQRNGCPMASLKLSDRTRLTGQLTFLQGKKICFPQAEIRAVESGVGTRSASLSKSLL